jgi:hypothetical protein
MIRADGFARRLGVHKVIVPVSAAATAAVLTLAITSWTSAATTSSYAEDRAAIEDLQRGARRVGP